MFFKQQGDVLFKKWEGDLPAGVKEVKVGDSYVVRHGESGHTHLLGDTQDVEVVMLEGKGQDLGLSLLDAFFIKVKGNRGVAVKHEEHGEVTLEPDTVFVVDAVQEYDYLSKRSRPVFD